MFGNPYSVSCSGESTKRARITAAHSTSCVAGQMRGAPISGPELAWGSATPTAIRPWTGIQCWPPTGTAGGAMPPRSAEYSGTRGSCSQPDRHDLRTSRRRRGYPYALPAGPQLVPAGGGSGRSPDSALNLFQRAGMKSRGRRGHLYGRAQIARPASTGQHPEYRTWHAGD